MNNKGLNHWWKRFERIKATLEAYRKKHNLKNIEECIALLLTNQG